MPCLLVLQWPRFDGITLRLRRIRWAVGANGMNSATTGFGAGENASKNKVAGRSQKLIAAASIGTVPYWQCATGTEAACQQFTAQAIRERTGQCLHCQVEAPGFSPGFFLENMRSTEASGR
jgi:hypothetical protein